LKGRKRIAQWRSNETEDVKRSRTEIDKRQKMRTRKGDSSKRIANLQQQRRRMDVLRAAETTDEKKQKIARERLCKLNAKAAESDEQRRDKCQGWRLGRLARESLCQINIYFSLE
jgi:hypothetical protein